MTILVTEEARALSLKRENSLYHYWLARIPGHKSLSKVQMLCGSSNGCMFFISGITGNVGGAAARRLIADGHKVRTVARDPQKAAEWSNKGVDVRRGDWNDAAALSDAFQEVEGAFLMIPPVPAPTPGFPEAKAIIASFVEALRQTPPPRLVVLSSVGSEQTSGLGTITTTHLMEEAFKALPFSTAFVRAGSFFENYAASLKPASDNGTFHSLLQPTDRAFPMVASADIGAEIARLLLNGWSGKRIVEIGSSFSPDNLASGMSEALGRPVRAEAVPRGQWAKALESFGMVPGTIGVFEEMMDGFNSGWIHFGVPGTEPVAGTLTPAQFFALAKKS